MKRVNNEWDELLHRIAEYAYELTPEQLKQLERDLGIEEYVTPFGVLHIIRHKLFAENT